MNALDLISLANQGLFVGLFVAVAWHAVRQPSRARLNTVSLFGSIAAVVVISQIAEWLTVDEPWLTAVILALLNVAPLAMLRLLDDFSGTPRWVQRAGAAAFALVVVLGFAAEATPGGGSTFHVAIPARPTPSPAEQRGDSPWPVAGAEVAADA